MNEPAERQAVKADVLALMAKGHEEISAWMAELKEDQRSAAPGEHAWGAKATLAHMAHWNLALIRAFELKGRGGVVPFQWADLDAQNARLLAECPGRTWAEVAAEADAAYRALRDCAERMTEEELAAADDFAWQEGGPLWQTFLGNTYFHYLCHLADYYDEAGQPDRGVELRAEYDEACRARDLHW